MEKNQKIAVTIAGNDSDGSAGMPADLHAFFVDGVYGHGLLTAAVSGNSYGIDAAQVMPKDYIEQQFKTLSTDFKISAAKTSDCPAEGLHANASAVLGVRKILVPVASSCTTPQLVCQGISCLSTASWPSKVSRSCCSTKAVPACTLSDVSCSASIPVCSTAAADDWDTIFR